MDASDTTHAHAVIILYLQTVLQGIDAFLGPTLSVPFSHFNVKCSSVWLGLGICIHQLTKFPILHFKVHLNQWKILPSPLTPPLSPKQLEYMEVEFLFRFNVSFSTDSLRNKWIVGSSCYSQS